MKSTLHTCLFWPSGLDYQIGAPHLGVVFAVFAILVAADLRAGDKPGEAVRPGELQFKASGEYEIMWHLFRWGAGVKILAPASLRKQYIELLKDTMEHQKEK